MADQFVLLSHWDAFLPIPQTLESIKKFTETLKLPLERHYVSLPFPYLQEAPSTLSSLNIILGCNDMHSVELGAFTKSVAIKLLKDSGARFVLLNTALKRSLNESSSSINQKVLSALEHDIQPFICFGETYNEFEEGNSVPVIKKQLQECLNNLNEESLQKVTLVYDTPWLLKAKSDFTVNDIKQLSDRILQIFQEIWGNLPTNIKILCLCPFLDEVNKTLIEGSIYSGFYLKINN